jgi:hypothetical protein
MILSTTGAILALQIWTRQLLQYTLQFCLLSQAALSQLFWHYQWVCSNKKVLSSIETLAVVSHAH